MLFPTHAPSTMVWTVSNEMAPFINIFNEFYTKDTSRKIKVVFKAKGNAGKPLCTNPPYGCLKNPEDKNHWIMNIEAAEVSGRFSVYVSPGTVPCRLYPFLKKGRLRSQFTTQRGSVLHCQQGQMAISLTGGMTPRLPGFSQGRNTPAIRLISRTRTKPFQDKKKLTNDPSELAIFENMHEAIVDQESFDIV